MTPRYSLYRIPYTFYLFTFTFFLVPLFFLFSCEQNKVPLHPLKDDTLKITSHKFYWEIDTLYAADAMQIYLRDVWGTDENNVWVVGHSDDFDYQIWHWDGNDWTNVNPFIIGDRPSYHELFGFSENDIWIVGEGIYRKVNDPNLYAREYILHYDGSQWHRLDEIKAPMCLSVWGASNSELYFGCDSGVVLYYNGSTIQKQQTGTDAQICSIWGFDSENVFATGGSLNTQEFYLFKKVGNHWEPQDSGSFGVNGNFVWGLDPEHFYRVTGSGVRQYVNGSWEYILYSRLVRCMFGNAENNMFVAGYQNELFHYNGEDWHKYSDFVQPHREFFGIWCNDASVFLIMGSLDYTYMVRGYINPH
ncbi:MAG: hypothetical protein Kow0037_32550 [Calditrichia bacterium]